MQEQLFLKDDDTLPHGKKKIEILLKMGAGQIYSRSGDFLVLRIFLLLWYM